jgi:hypothetical protein
MKDDLVRYCRENGRVCPMRHNGMRFGKCCRNRARIGGGWEPAPPLILAAWHDTPALPKMQRLKEHIEWADQHGVLGDVDKVLRSLPETEWAHLGEQ